MTIVMLQIVPSLTDDSRGIIYNHIFYNTGPHSSKFNSKDNKVVHKMSKNLGITGVTFFAAAFSANYHHQFFCFKQKNIFFLHELSVINLHTSGACTLKTLWIRNVRTP